MSLPNPRPLPISTPDTPRESEFWEYWIAAAPRIVAAVLLVALLASVMMYRANRALDRQLLTIERTE